MLIHLSNQQQLPETKNRTFEEIAALFKPIQFAGQGPAVPDYGCAVTDLGLPDTQSGYITGSPHTSANASGGQYTGQQTLDGHQTPYADSKNPQNRFRFDSIATGSFINDQHASCSHRTNGGLGPSCPDHCSNSQGNLNCSSHLPPHNHSCTSVHTQNLSTSDQQPLIVDVHYNDHICNHNHHDHQHIDNHSLTTTTTTTTTNMKSSIMSAQAKQLPPPPPPPPLPPPPTVRECCCLEQSTTSFMAGKQPRSVANNLSQNKTGCLYCERDASKGPVQFVTIN